MEDEFVEESDFDDSFDAEVEVASGTEPAYGSMAWYLGGF